VARRERIDDLPGRIDARARIYLQPIGLIYGATAAHAVAAGRARPLAGGRIAFTACEALIREQAAVAVCAAGVEALAAWIDGLGDGPAAARLRETWARLQAPRPPVAGVPMDRPALMGVINVTPDSFSDGGDHAETAAAVAHGRALAEAGAAILDVGGESTRPGAEPVPAEVELARAVPVVRGLAGLGVPISIDSRRAAVMRAAIEAGAAIVNDVSALGFDPESLATVAAAGAPVVLMHSQGDPRTMQRAPAYDDAPLDVYDMLESRINACLAAGIERARILIDPGIGFGKSPTGHNVEILQSLALYHGLGCPVVLGVSRKSFIARLSADEPPKARLPGSLAAGLAGLDQGVQILRVHDVAETAQALAVWRALRT